MIPQSDARCKKGWVRGWRRRRRKNRWDLRMEASSQKDHPSVGLWRVLAPTWNKYSALALFVPINLTSCSTLSVVNKHWCAIWRLLWHSGDEEDEGEGEEDGYDEKMMQRVRLKWPCLNNQRGRMFVKRATVQSISKQFDLQRYISKHSKINSRLYSTSDMNFSKKAKIISETNGRCSGELSKVDINNRHPNYHHHNHYHHHCYCHHPYPTMKLNLDYRGVT